MVSIFKRLIGPVFILYMLVGCGPKAPDLSGLGKALGKINDLVACSLAALPSDEEVFYLALDEGSLTSQFSANVKPLNIKTFEAFEASAPAEAREFIKAIVDQEFEKLGEPAVKQMHSKEFYYKLVTRALLNVVYDPKPLGNWRFAQAEFIETAPKEKTVRIISLYLSIQKAANLNKNSNQKNLSLDHEAILFCD